MTTCNPCEGTGFMNLSQIPEPLWQEFEKLDEAAFIAAVNRWIDSNEMHDVAICQCCGDGDEWYGIPGQHYSDNDLPGTAGPYAYNGGLCECD